MQRFAVNLDAFSFSLRTERRWSARCDRVSEAFAPEPSIFQDFLGTTPLMRHALRPGDWKLHIAVVHVVAGSIEEPRSAGM